MRRYLPGSLFLVGNAGVVRTIGLLRNERNGDSLGSMDGIGRSFPCVYSDDLWKEGKGTCWGECSIKKRGARTWRMKGRHKRDSIRNV